MSEPRLAPTHVWAHIPLKKLQILELLLFRSFLFTFPSFFSFFNPPLTRHLPVNYKKTCFPPKRPMRICFSFRIPLPAFRSGLWPRRPE